MRAETKWPQWEYHEWNERLVDYCFHAQGRQIDQPVERIPATPDELREIVDDPEANPLEVVETFVERVKETMPPYLVSFCGFCKDYRGWTPEADRPPHFFAMLWLTCLVAYGYPDGQGGFHARLGELFGRTQFMDCLPKLWSDFQKWTLRAHASPSKGTGYRVLILPDPGRYRTDIGHSWFLAFPHHHDRRTLRNLLVRSHLVGDEPPIAPVIAKLRENEEDFSDSFRRVFDRFVEDFVGTGQDVRKSPFWRAVRQEALPPEEGSWPAGATERMSLMATFYSYDLIPYVACSEETSLPPGFSKLDLPFEIDDLSKFVSFGEDRADPSAGMRDAADAALEGSLPVPRAATYARRGVLVFQEELRNEYRLVGGSEANEALMSRHRATPDARICGNRL